MTAELAAHPCIPDSNFKQPIRCHSGFARWRSRPGMTRRHAPSPVFFSGAGCAVFLPRRSGAFCMPPAKSRGWSAKRRTSLSVAAFPLGERGRLSALHRGFAPPAFARDTGPGSALPGTRLAPIPVQRAPRGGVLVPPGRFPGPPGSGVTNPARGRRTHRRRFPAADPLERGACSPAPALAWLHHRDVSRRRPQRARRGGG